MGYEAHIKLLYSCDKTDHTMVTSDAGFERKKGAKKESA